MHSEDYLLRSDISASSDRTVMIEERYVDRDFMADHTVLFASTLQPPPNHCRRLHFFAGDPETMYKKLLEISDLLSNNTPRGRAECDRACEQFE